ncbi:hypothetical protein BUALT_Bualt03G0021300 [Buddleja alternifolia]|uniref:Uncharacterized protein n=1 Tax=Buddleja alternifolia TaxID=168488 RepID=A0AAV6Y1D1_9LAMI|nr:hypothetical protein BUALT_Bualt03G0021300 [Buddleja alternifolia]
MSLERSEQFCVRFNGKNYSAWEFQFQIFVKGKELWGHLDGTNPTLDREKEKEKYVKWEVKDAQIMSWILGSVDPSILLNLKPYKTSRQMWEYLKKVYNQTNTARRFQLELELGLLVQGNMSVQDFYSSFETIWAEYTDIVYTSVPPEGLFAVQGVHEASKQDQFLMKLRGEFEGIRSSLMNRNPVPILDVCLSELFREEQRLITQAAMEQKIQNSAPIPVAEIWLMFSATVAKATGHIIKDCPTRPPKKSEKAYNVSVDSSSASGPATTSAPPNVPSLGQSSITPEMVQQMIVSALSALGISGNKKSTSKPWYFDSGASNHMTNSVLPLSNVQKYKENLQIHTVDGTSLPITAVGDFSASLNTVFVSPNLSTNLISVGQLVENNCNVQFSNSGCVVQDQVSGKMIAQGPKVGRLFPLFLSFPSPLSNSVACNVVQCDNQVWHKRLGHPNPHVLRILLKTGLLGNKNYRFDDVNIDCVSCKLGKSKTLPFPSHTARTTKPFELIHTDVWGIAPVISHEHYKYFVTFIDDFTRFTWIYFLRRSRPKPPENDPNLGPTEVSQNLPVASDPVLATDNDLVPLRRSLRAPKPPDRTRRTHNYIGETEQGGSRRETNSNCSKDDVSMMLALNIENF